MAGVNIAHLLVEAKNLANKLQEDDKSTDQLINNAQNVSEKISCLKEYKECLNDLHDGRSTQRPRSVLVHNLQQENRQIKILQDENRQLKMALEEHQIAIDLIMKRYRQQVTELVQLNQCQQNAFQMADFLKIKDQNFYSEMSSLSKFASLFDQCMKFGEEASRKDQQELVRLKAENQLLRRLLKIASDRYPSSTAAANQEKEENPPTTIANVPDVNSDDESTKLLGESLEKSDDYNENLLKFGDLNGIDVKNEIEKLDEMNDKKNATEIPIATTTTNNVGAKGFLSKMTAPIKARSVGKRISLPCTSETAASSKTSSLVRKSPSTAIANAVVDGDASTLRQRSAPPPSPRPVSSSNYQKRRSAAAAPPTFVSQSPSSIRQSKSSSFNKTSTSTTADNNRKNSTSIR